MNQRGGLTDETVLLRREWLNKEGFHSNAFVFAEVSLADYLPVLKFGDCYNIVSLWFQYDPKDEPSMENALYKADMILEVVKQYRDAMANAMAHHREHPLKETPRQRRSRRRPAIEGERPRSR